MTILFVVDRLQDWRCPPAGAMLMTARDYLADPGPHCNDTRVVNLCDVSRYQGSGYYVSMVAEARGQRPLPSIRACEDVKAGQPLESLAATLDLTALRSLDDVDNDTLTLEIRFGDCQDPQWASLARRLSDALGLPLMRIELARHDNRWQLNRVVPLALRDLDSTDVAAIGNTACMPTEPAAKTEVRKFAPRRTPQVAILRTPGPAAMPSNPNAIAKFIQAAERLGMRAELITRDDADRLNRFDALFIRDTTHVNDDTYRIARRALLDGLVVIDDPDSILRCSNKLFLHELLSRHRVPMPRTLPVQRADLATLVPALGVPLILKQPDGAFSMGVARIETPQQLERKAEELFAGSALLLAQEYLPTAFDWRIGILARKPLFACRYHMAAGHWQVIKHEGDSRYSEGRAEAVALDAVPDTVLRIALQAADLIGDGFYGVDLKQRDGRCCVIEVNDNPNVDAGNEDGVIGDLLYESVMRVLRERIEANRS